MAAERTTKAEFLHQLAAERSHLIAAIAGLSEEEMCRPGTLENQSVKDVLAHITFWDEQAIANLGLMLAGKSDEIVRPADEEETSAWNDRERQRRHDQSLADVIGQLEEKRHTFLALLETATDELLNAQITVRPKMITEPAYWLLAEDTSEHDKVHVADILEWRRSIESSET
jgi:hypothetical protein